MPSQRKSYQEVLQHYGQSLRVCSKAGRPTPSTRKRVKKSALGKPIPSCKSIRHIESFESVRADRHGCILMPAVGYKQLRKSLQQRDETENEDGDKHLSK